MKFLMLMAISTCSMIASATVIFTGTWNGAGTLTDQTMAAPVSVNMSLDMTLTDTDLTIKDCWSNLALQIQGCNNLDYTVTNQEIFNQGAKIGNVLPGQIVIFSGNDQGSEQMVFNFNDVQNMTYQYDASAIDGTSQIRRGALVRAN